jgi:hypothetical protein
MPKQTKSKRSATLDNVLVYYVQTLADCDPNYDETAVDGQLRNLRSQFSDDHDQIYDELDAAYPVYGHPLNLFENCFEEDPRLAERAKKSADKAKKAAAKAQRRAETEFDDRLKCAELEQKKRHVEAYASDLSTECPQKRSLFDSSTTLLLTCGAFVLIQQDLSPGMCSYGGEGWVTEVSGYGASTKATVKYLENEPGCIEANIPLRRITTINTLFVNNDSNKRRRVTVTPPKVTVPERPHSLKEALEDAHRRRRQKGWRSKDLGLAKANRIDRRKVIVHDITEFKGLRSNLEKQQNTNRESSGQFGMAKSRKSDKISKSGPLTIQFLADAWTSRAKGLHKMLKLSPQELVQPKPLTASQKSSIECREAAKAFFTPQRLYIAHYIHANRDEISALAYEQSALAAKCYVWGEMAKGMWVGLGDAEKEVWKFKARNHDERQSQIKDQVLASLRKNPTKSFDKVAADIGYWCSANTIFRWLTSHLKMSKYMRCGAPSRQNFQTVRRRLLWRERMALGATGAADASHEQPGSRRVPGNVQKTH